MLAQQRQRHILDELERHGGVRVSALAQSLGVSDMTVRRDLDVLARQGLLEKVHGGATLAPAARSTEEPGFEAKSALMLAEKEAICRQAATLVSPGAAVGVTAGTTTYTLARHLALVPGITVVTNSVRVSDVLHMSGRTDQTVVLTGGLRTPSDALVGPVAVAALRSLHVDLLFMGVHGMDIAAGFTTPNLMEAEADQAMIDSARRLVVVADHTKWATIGLSRIAPLHDADVLVTDTGLPRAAQEVLADEVGELILAAPEAVPREAS